MKNLSLDLDFHGELNCFFFTWFRVQREEGKKSREGKRRRKLLLSKLRSFNSDPALGISSDETHHTMIVTILILDCASLFYASPSRPTLDDALDQAFSQYKSSGTHNAVKEQFSRPPEQYSFSHFAEFVLSHRLR